MNALSTHFLRAATIYAVIGMALGNYMGASGDHSQMPTHAHLLLLGWVSMAIYGLFYRGLSSEPASKLMVAHKWLAHISLIALTCGLAAMFAGHYAVEPVVGLASIVTLISMVIFSVIVFKATKA
jgi:hypothetical protein